jgi:hypothetical protein
VQAVREIFSHGRDRLIRLARSARGYLAGFGTSGSLLAGAALMFIVASALVAFRGWPHVAAQPSPGEVVVSPRPAAAGALAGSLVARRLTLISAGVAGRGAGVGAPAVAGVQPGGGAGTAPTGSGGSIGSPASTSRPVSGTAGTPISAGSAPVASGASGSSAGTGPSSSVPSVPVPVPSVPVPPVPSPAPVQQVIKQTTGALGDAVSSAGNQAGSVVQQTTGAVGGAVAPVSPAAAGAVNSVGSGATKTVTGVTQALGGTLSGLGGN